MNVFIISFLPILILGLFIYLRDIEKEPIGLLLKLFLLGIVSCIPSFFVELLFIYIFGNLPDMNIYTLILYSFFGIALVEEFFKYIMTYLFSYNHKELDGVYDMVVYATFVSLGFAFLENICYVYLYGFFTGIFRALLSVPCHACNGIIMGYYFGLAKWYSLHGNKKREKKYLWLSLLMAILAHGFYDFCVISNNLFLFIVFIVYVICIYIYCFRKVNSVAKEYKDFIT